MGGQQSFRDQPHDSGNEDSGLENVGKAEATSEDDGLENDVKAEAMSEDDGIENVGKAEVTRSESATQRWP